MAKKKKLKEYLIELPVTAARGCQVFSVMAESEEDALARQTDWKFVQDEIEVTDVGDPRVIDNQ